LLVHNIGGTLSLEEIREVVDEAKKPGVFKIVDVLKDRAYPKMEVTVAVDEEAAYKASLIKEEIAKLDLKFAKKEKSSKDAEREEKLTAEHEALMEAIKSSSFTFHLEGISEGRRNEIYKNCVKRYPLEYEREIDISTGKMEKIEKVSTERDALFTDFLWEACITKIVNADGDEQVGVSYTDVRTMRDQMPLSATARINESIEKLRVASAVFMMEVDEDFLAKSSPGETTE
jgi:hypothetical protein